MSISASVVSATEILAVKDAPRLVYGDVDVDNQYIKIYPPRTSGALTFAIIHGGFWKAEYALDSSLIDTLCPYLQSRGYGVCLIEYRRVGHTGGGWPGTNEDILSALRKLHAASQESSVGIDFNRIVVLGHSAGATLALWACCRLQERDLPFRPRLCAALAPVADLVAGHDRRLSSNGDAVPLYVGCSPNAESSTCPYKRASPHFLLPLQVDTLLVSGDVDEDVPCDLVKAFHDSAVAARASEGAGPRIELLSLENCGHINMVTATEEAWLKIVRKIEEMTC